MRREVADDQDRSGHDRERAGKEEAPPRGPPDGPGRGPADWLWARAASGRGPRVRGGIGRRAGEHLAALRRYGPIGGSGLKHGHDRVGQPARHASGYGQRWDALAAHGGRQILRWSDVRAGQPAG